MNAYYNKGKTQQSTSDAIRRLYLERLCQKDARRSESAIAASRVTWVLFMILKCVGSFVCVIGFFTILGKIEAEAISPFMGIVATLAIAALESLCFLPISQKPKKAVRKADTYLREEAAATQTQK